MSGTRARPAAAAAVRSRLFRRTTWVARWWMSARSRRLARCASRMRGNPSGQRQQLADLVVAGLREIFVPEAHGVERVRRDRAHDIIDGVAKRVTGLRGGGWHGDDDAARFLLA